MRTKKLMKRLLGILLALVMVVGSLPLGMTETVKAADLAAGTVIYLDLSNHSDWRSDEAKFGFVSTKNNTNQPRVVMEQISGTNIWKGALLSEATNILFQRLNPNNIAGDAWNTCYGWPALETGKNMFILNSGGWSPTGYWSVYEGGDTPDPVETSTYYASVDMVDYLNDARVDDNDGSPLRYKANNQGDLIKDRGGESAAFEYLNQQISNQGYQFPLYFGALVHVKNRVGRSYMSGVHNDLSNWNTTANVALTDSTGKAGNYNASVSGLVANELGANGELLSIDGKELPFFSNSNTWTAPASDKGSGNKLINYYSDYQFPFNGMAIANSTVKKYSYDSATDKAVYMNWDNLSDKKLYTSDRSVYNENKENGQLVQGYFPFNKPGDSGAARNYGFGSKFTIPFTINENGTLDGTENGEAITFEFTGDDDVWVFLDGKLILDMGGAHGKASGRINFKTLKATVDNAAVVSNGYEQMSNQVSSGNIETYKKKNLKNYVYEDGTERSTVDTAQQTKEFSDYGANYTGSFEDPSNVHTLTMFYMERGMYDSNMKIEFTINPLPSGLSLSKQVNVETVNSGLQEAMSEKDTFDFTIKTGASQENISETAANLPYELYNGNSAVASNTGAEGKVTLKDKQHANAFKNSENTGDAFTPGTWFQIDEAIGDNYTTRWFVTDLDSNDTTKPVASADNSTSAKFQFGENTGEFSKANYNVNFINTPKVGGLTLTKKWKQGQTAPTNGQYNFRVLIDLAGGSDYKKYNLSYSVDSGTQQTATNGEFVLEESQTATILGIPVGATYKIEEIVPNNANYQPNPIEFPGTIEHYSNQENRTPSANNQVTITNSFKPVECDKVIYVEAGKDTTYEVKDGDDKIKVNSDESGQMPDLPAGVTGSVDENGTPTFNFSQEDKQYDVTYTGKKDNGTDVTGTIIVFTYKATDKVYVFDYGLEANIAETNADNDGLFQEGVFNNTYAEGDNKATATLGQIDKTDTSKTQTDITPDNNITIRTIDSKNEAMSGENKANVMFKPKAFMDQVEDYNYTANVKKDSKDTLDENNPETGAVLHGTIKVMPANVVYYEDNFNSNAEKDSSVKIVYTGTVVNNDQNEPTTGQVDLNEELLGTQDITQNQAYGYDSSFNSGANSSANENKSEDSFNSTEMGATTTATFEFKGTGFEIMGRTTTDTGRIAVKVTNLVTGKRVKSIIVDTFYQNGALYQIPVISVKDLPEIQGKYKVELLVASAPNGESQTFYLDGVRIFNPLGENGDDAYQKAIGEQKAEMKEIRNLILNDHPSVGIVQTVTNSTTNETTFKAGSSYVEWNAEAGYESHPEGTIKEEDMTYLKCGPNNEIYLRENETIAFYVKPIKDQNGEVDPDRGIQVAAKAPNGKSKMHYSIADQSKVADIVSATEQYYRLINGANEKNYSDQDGKYLITIKGNGSIKDGDGPNENGDAPGMLSLTCLKVKGYEISIPNIESEPSEAVMSMLKSVCAIQEIDEPVNTEININSASVKGKTKVNSNIELCVVTTINTDNVLIENSAGEVITPTNIVETRKSNKNQIVWEISIPATQKGTNIFTVYGVDEVGIKSLSYKNVTAIVK